jgi:signal transduction histidine kinase
MLGRNIVLALAYFASGKLSLWLASTGGGFAAPCWPPAGISIAALLAWGWRAAPGVWIGAFLTNLSVSHWEGFGLASCIATGNMLEALLARELLTRVFGFSKLFERTSDVIAYGITALLAPAASAGIGVASVHLISGTVPPGTITNALATWWVGDAVGALVVGPLLFSSVTPAKGAPLRNPADQSPPYVLLAATLAILIVDFGIPNHLQPILSAILVFASLMICSIRFPMRRLFLVIVLISAASVYRSYLGYATLTLIDDRVQRIFMIQFILGAATLTAMLLNAAVSEKLRALAQAHERELALMSASRAAVIGEMAAGIAHEINNPLTVLSSKAQTLQSRSRAGELERTEILDATDGIIRMSDRITKIVRSLHFFARKAEADPFETVSFREIANQTLELCAKHFKDSGVRLEIDPIPESLVIRCRPVEVGQMLLNLLSNAAAAARPLHPMEEPAGWVRLSAREEGDDLELSVTDSGDGVPEEVRARIFDPFFTTRSPGQGSGLGLSISREVAENHGGRLWLDETSGNTRFVARIPRVVRP